MNKKRNNAVGPQVRELNGNKPKRHRRYSIMAFIALILGYVVTTQHFAHSFNYNSLLGVNYGGVYPPWAFPFWLNQFYHDHTDAFLLSGSIGAIVSGLFLVAVAMLKLISSNDIRPSEYLHGSARWADKSDIKEAGLLESEGGVFVGGWLDKKGVVQYLRHSGPEHVLTYAPTRSGKGIGLVLPTLLSWLKSALITDLKGELWELTAGWRQQYAKNKVLKFEPASMTASVAWNPLEEIRIGTEYEVGDVQNLATLIVDPDGKGLNDHWQKTSQALLVGLILHVIYKAKNEGGEATLNMVDKTLSDPNRGVDDLWVEMTTYEHVNEENHPLVGQSGRDMIDRPEEEAGSVLSTAKSYLSLYRDPIVAKNTSRCDFKIHDLMNHDNPVSLYVVTQPSDKARLRPLVRVFINMTIRLLAGKMTFENGQPKANYKHKLLAMFDEFPSLGKLEILQESLAFLAGYGIKCYLICQDINQLKSREMGYGRDETITSNCHVQNAYPPNRPETAAHLSKLTGQTTVLKDAFTISGKRLSGFQNNITKSINETSRPLLTDDECLRMPGPKKDNKGLIVEAGDMVIYVAGYPAIYGKQVLYFKDKAFLARSKVPAPKLPDVLRGTVHQEAVEIEL
ncbi:type IV secretory system conjugative DNA transfer family protein [Pseudoalteromonas sp. Of11M-6]|uniref:type IV secretory system conjugative DNA transfer family protein n=1 Tax=Pseudoalteromonas sp. Of11M-6 TaxID=2917754 RepID=UPI001EF51087|nr:type IV secretory system conjugative DNA transfer family protein [Pseudoalteromonas sp. Of11M-6]MCG7556063.1 type IV secretory system conjugative DNA transfer family protein [Pseudoalteromonas sp. Of11M-6]